MGKIRGLEMKDSKIIDTFEKNTLEEVRTQLTNFKGYDLLDIRVYVKKDPEKDYIPTKKGLTLKTELLPRLKEALLKAEKTLKTA